MGRTILQTTYRIILVQTKTKRAEEHVKEEYVSFLAQQAVPTEMTLSQIQEATVNDPALQTLIDFVANGQWHTIKQGHPRYEKLVSFRKVEDELTVSSSDNCILRGSRLVVPQKLQQNKSVATRESFVSWHRSTSRRKSKAA